MSLNLVLGDSEQTAIATMRRCRTAHTVCVVSPSPRQDRRISDEGLIESFRELGTIMKRLVRLEAHFHAAATVWLPCRALTEALRQAHRLEGLLLNGVRLKGSMADFIELGHALQGHPELKRTCLFNVDYLPDGSSSVTDPLERVIEGMVRNPDCFDFTLRYCHWANPYMGILCDERSNLQILRVSGKETLYGSNGDGDNMGFPMLMESLKANRKLTELIINQCPGPLGSGALIAETLRHNETLQKLYFHVQQFSECVPIAEVLERENRTITHLEFCVEDPSARKMGGSDDDETSEAAATNARAPARRARAAPAAVPHVAPAAQRNPDISAAEQRLQDQLARLQRNAGAAQQLDPADAAAANGPENNDNVNAEELKTVTDALEKALDRNDTVVHIKVNTRSGLHSSPQMDLLLRMNRAGTKAILQNDALSSEEALEFLEKYSHDTCLVWNMLRMKVSLIPLMIDAAAAARKEAEAKRAAEESDSDDEVKRFGSFPHSPSNHADVAFYNTDDTMSEDEEGGRNRASFVTSTPAAAAAAKSETKMRSTMTSSATRSNLMTYNNRNRRRTSIQALPARCLKRKKHC